MSHRESSGLPAHCFVLVVVAIVASTGTLWAQRTRPVPATVTLLAGAASGETVAPAAAPARPSRRWKLVWRDEFKGPGVDSANWTFIVSGEGGGNHERQFYTDGDNARIVLDRQAEDRHALLIEARKENPADYQCWYGPCQYTSARLVTEGKRSWKHGKIEARIRLPFEDGSWAAFWALDSSGGRPDYGEIDILELVGGTQCGDCGDNHVFGTIWWQEGSLKSNGAQGADLPAGIYADAYHVFGIEWDEERIAWFVDGRPLLRADDGRPIAAGIAGSEQTELHQPFYLLLNLAIGGDWPHDPPASATFPQRMYVDWVRVYQRRGR